MIEDWTGIGTGDGSFPLTRLTLLRKAREESPDARKEALGVLWQSYWKPLYAYARHLRLGNEAAKDLVQSFCARAIEGDLLARFDPSRGRLRTWLRTCFHSFFLDALKGERAGKRGGGQGAVPIEEALGVRSEDPAGGDFDRTWALGLIERAFERWKRELAARPDDRWRLELVSLLQSDGYGKLPPLPELAARLGVSESRVRHFVHRDSKMRLKEEILLEVREGSSGEAEAREELDYLLRCVAQG